MAVVEVLLAYGADVNIGAGVCMPPLLWTAGGSGNPAVIKVLLEHGADVNVRDSFGRTPLYLAAELGNRDAVKSLLENGANADTLTNWGESVVDKAIMAGHEDIVDLLRQHGGKQKTVWTPRYPLRPAAEARESRGTEVGAEAASEGTGSKGGRE